MKPSVKLGVILMVIGLFCPYNSFADKDSIWVGGMVIKIGMAKTPALSEIAKSYKMTKNNSEDEWSIFSKDSNDIVGVIDFKNEKVYRVTKFWGSFSGDQGFEFATKFFNLLSNLESEGEEMTFFYTHSAKEPKSSHQSITFYLGAKQVEVFIGEDEKYGRYMSINEVLSKPH